jgi:hypothetical protein
MKYDKEFENYRNAFEEVFLTKKELTVKVGDEIVKLFPTGKIEPLNFPKREDKKKRKKGDNNDND